MAEPKRPRGRAPPREIEDESNPLKMDPLTSLELVLDAARLANLNALPEFTQMRIKSAITQLQDLITNASGTRRSDVE